MADSQKINIYLGRVNNNFFISQRQSTIEEIKILIFRQSLIIKPELLEGTEKF